MELTITAWESVSGNSGRDEETLDEAKKRAPRTIKSRCRAVSVEDFEYLAMQASTIKRAKALPLFHPDFPGIKVPGVITVIVVPDGDDPAPTPSEGTLRTVCAYLDQRRLLTTELYVIKPSYQQVEIEAEVVADDNADLATVKKGRRANDQRVFPSTQRRGRRSGLALWRHNLLLASQSTHFQCLRGSEHQAPR